MGKAGKELGKSGERMGANMSRGGQKKGRYFTREDELPELGRGGGWGGIWFISKTIITFRLDHYFLKIIHS